MNALKIKWLTVGSYVAETTLFDIKFTLKIDKPFDCNRDSYIIECESGGFSEPLFTEIKAVGIHCAKKLAEEIIVDFICSELKKANEDG